MDEAGMVAGLVYLRCALTPIARRERSVAAHSYACERESFLVRFRRRGDADGMWSGRLVLVIALAAIGCGGSSAKPDGGGTAGSGGTAGGGGGSGGGAGSGACGTVEPCGGAIVGTWNLTAECVNSIALAPLTQAICAQATITAINVGLSGTATFAADLTYSFSQNVTVMVTWDVPSSCLTGETCDYFASMFEPQLPAGTTFTCTGSTSCTCTEAAAGAQNDNGTYAATGSSLSVTSAVSGMTANGGYCVQGSTLHLITPDATLNMGPMGQATIDKDVVGQRQ